MDPARRFSAFLANCTWKHRLAVAAVLACVVIGPLWHLRVIDRVYLPFNRSDLLQCWAATRVAMSGGDPWSAEAVEHVEAPYYAGLPDVRIHTRPQPFFYPGHLLPLLLPLAPLSWPAARLLFLIASPLVLLGTTWLGLRALGLPLPRSAAILVSVLACCSWPAMWSFRLQQLTIFIAAAVLASLFCLVRRRQLAAGVLLALATTKPPLAIPLILWLVLRAIVRREWRFVASLCGSTAVLLYCAARLTPGWIPRWLALLHTYPAVPQLQHAFGHVAGVILESLIAVAAALTLWRLRRCPADSPQFRAAFGLALAVAVLLSPWQPPMIYNYLLLIPAALFIVFRVPEQPVAAKLRLLLLVQVVFDVGAAFVSAAGETLTGAGNLWADLPFLDVLLPILATAILILEGWRLAKAERPVTPVAVGATAG